MNRRTTLLAAFACAPLLLPAAAGASAGAERGQAAADPGHGLHAVPGVSVRPRGRRGVTVSWDAPAGDKRPAGYRLLRAGKRIRSTKRLSLKVRTSRRAQRLQVVPVDAAGHVGPRSRTVVIRAGHRPPTRPAALAASRVSDSAATLSWRRARASHARIAHYRVISARRTVRASRRTRIRLTGLASAQTRVYRIVAVDSLGWTSTASRGVTVKTGHHAPSAPGAPTATSVTDTTVSLSWPPAALPASSRLRGYRIMRDGAVVAQVPATQASIGNLAPKSAHSWTVAAVDTLGYVSAPSPATRVVQGDPSPTAGGIHAFLLASTDSSFAAFRAHYAKIGVIYPTFYDCSRSTGQIEGRNDERIVRFAQDRKVKVLPRFNCQSTPMVHKILTDPAMRSQWLDSMTALADQNGWDGLNVDFEAIPADDRAQLTSFIADLSDRLHARGKLLSQAVSGKTEDVAGHPRSGAFDYKALASYDDYVFVMAWGIHWATSAPGAQDDFTWVRGVRDYVATMPHRERFVMGTMLYGMDWPAGGGPSHPGAALHYAEIEALRQRYGLSPTYDPQRRASHLGYSDGSGVAHDVWYSDAGAVGDRVALAREQGLKVGFWRVGQEDERIWADPRLPSGG
jgi:spore germination protein YaaH